jgi:geranylgeranyl transferase type-2 subunit alpha
LGILELTSKVLKLNPEFYTIWNYRREVLLRTHFVAFTAPPEAPTKDASEPPEETVAHEDPAAVTESLRTAHESRLALLLKEELEFLIPLLMSFPKCYWIWNHRLWTLQQSSTLLTPEKAVKFWAGELQLVGMMLTRDARNFHGWMYRRIVVAHLERPAGDEYESMVKDELEYTRQMVRGVGGMKNYSAWHQRSKLLPRMLNEQGAEEQDRMDCLEDELQLLMSAIETDPEDQSLWFYYRWLVAARDQHSIAPKMPHLTRIAMVSDQVEWLKELLEAHPDCRFFAWKLRYRIDADFLWVRRQVYFEGTGVVC